MTEQQATAVAEALGGETWQSGGDVWLVVLKRSDGKVVCISSEAVCLYDGEEEMETGQAEATILLG